ncbi:type I restriction endonuclease subunit R, partial [Halorubrum sp. SD626R]
VEAEVLEVEREAGDEGMEAAEFAIYTHLTEETPGAIESEEQAKEVAEEIVSQFQERVDRGYNGWKTNKKTISEIEHILLDVLVVEYGLGHLIQDDDDFVDAVRNYLIQNDG